MRKVFTLLFLLMVTVTQVIGQELTIADYNSNSGVVPFNAYNLRNYNQRSQYVMRSDMLGSMNGKSIHTIRLYSQSLTLNNTWTNTFNVYFKEVDFNTITEFVDTGEATLVYSGQITCVNGEMELVLIEPFTYNGGNLLICFDIEKYSSGSTMGVTFLGRTESNAEISIYGNNSTSLETITPNQGYGFVPMMSFEWAAMPEFDGVVYVKPESSGTSDGSSWANATNNIRWAIRAASKNGNLPVWIAAGTYTTDGYNYGNYINLVNGVSLYGGFAGNEPANYNLDNRDFATNTTILDGNNRQRVINQPKAFNTQTCVDGFDICHGAYATSSGSAGVYLMGNGCLRNCNIYENNNLTSSTSNVYGGVYATNATISHCNIYSNTTTTNGTVNSKVGGLYAINGTVVDHCKIYNNTGCVGGVYLSGNTTYLDNCLVANNNALTDYGGLYLNGAIIVNCDIVRNTGYGIYGSGTMTNSIVWGNGSGNMYNNNVVARNCAIGGDYSGPGTVTITDSNDSGEGFHPYFVNPSSVVGIDEDFASTSYQLQSGSVCVNNGRTAGLTLADTDLAGNTRVQQGNIDMGCYESPHTETLPIPTFEGGIVYVKPNGSGTKSGMSWDNAMDNINTAITTARNNELSKVWIAAGTYNGQSGYTSAFTIYNGVSIYGGFTGNEPVDYNLDDRDFETNTTILDGNYSQRVIYQSSVFSDTTYIDGFTITNGYTTSSDGGAGLYIRKLCYLRHCVVSSNSTSRSGGGIRADGSIIDDVHIVGNSATQHGGGIYAVNAKITNSIIESNSGNTNNSSSYYGGGAYLYNNSSLTNCIIKSNNDGYVGGVYADYNSTISRCDIQYNSCYSSSGLMGVWLKNNCTMDNCLIANNYGENIPTVNLGSSSKMINCTVVRNNGKTINGSGTIINSIIWGNDVAGLASTSLTIHHSAIDAAYNGDGNLQLETENTGDGSFFVRFADPYGSESSAWQLTDGSVCVNRGTSEDITIPALDLAGNVRTQQGAIDMGCFESPYTKAYAPIFENQVYVKVGGAGDKTGISWENACDNLVDAITTATSAHLNVWVAAGTYYGDGTSANAFTISDGVSLYGGFAGDEPSEYDLTLRDTVANRTILDGQNVQRVVYQSSASSKALYIDGFTIQNGNASGNGGGVLLNHNGHLQNCIIKNNKATNNGGGAAVAASSYAQKAYMDNCLVFGNTANTGNDYYGSVGGGGVYGCNANINNVTISNNIAQSGSGSGLMLISRSAVSGCVVENNINARYGGGVYMENSSTLTGCTISGNSASEGGGVYMKTSSSITNSTLSGNSSSSNYGELYAAQGTITNVTVSNNQNTNSSTVVYLNNSTMTQSTITGSHNANGYAFDVYQSTVTYCKILSNQGYGVRLNESSTLDNCLVANNGLYGVTISSNSNQPAKVQSCDIVNNGSYGLYGYSGIYGSVVNTIVWGNTRHVSLPENVILTNCAVTGGYDGIDNVPLDAENDGTQYHHPKFENPSTVVGYDDSGTEWSWQLTEGSVCANRGTDFDIISHTTDLAGNPRIQQDIIDIGCYESPYTESEIPSYDDDIVYVVPGGAGNKSGMTWDNAVDDINEAINMALVNNVSKVWVAPGTYYGDVTGENAFTLANKANLFGGVAIGTAPDSDLSERDLVNNPTILDGQNARRVIYQTASFADTTYVDGFTIQNGTADKGGGAYIKHRTFLRNCTVKNNTATASGGGLYCEGGLVMDNVITENSVTGSNGQGGGVYLTTCSDGTYSYSTNFRNCMVTNNVSSSVGGGIFINSGYCYTSTISGNNASSFGGGIYMSYGSIQQSEITGNTSPKTAGIYSNREYSNPNNTIKYCTISSNISTGTTGDDIIGGIFGKNTDITNCVITNNVGSYGGVYNCNTMTNCLVANNNGTGVYSPSTIINCDIVRNSGTGISCKFYAGGYTVINSIIWGNGSSLYTGDSAYTTTIKNCAIEGGYSGENNIMLMSDNEGGGYFFPRFDHPSAAPGVDNSGTASYQLTELSICINEGTTDGITPPATDLAGNQRILYDAIDIGCYESPYNTIDMPNYTDGIIYVTQSGSGNRSGTSWHHATNSINYALELAGIVGNVDIWVAKGTYQESGGTANAIELIEGVSLYGGFAGDEPADFDLNERDFVENATILDGQNTRRIVNQALAFDEPTYVDGFTIQNGYYSSYSSGVYLRANGTLKNCIVTNNRGGSSTIYAVYANENAHVENCVVTNNSIIGVFARENATVSHCTITNNAKGGVELLNNSGSPSTTIMDNCLVANNSGNYGVYSYGLTCKIINCDIVNNANVGLSGGSGSVINTIIWGNNNGGQQYSGSSYEITYSAVQGGYEGEGNLNLEADNFGTDPEAAYVCFMNPTPATGVYNEPGSWSFQLTPTSSCREAATMTGITIPELDLLGKERVIDDLDMGCYEFNGYLIEYTVDQEICEGEDYNGYGFEVIQPVPGEKIYSHYEQSVLGFDSIVHLDLVVHPKYLIVEDLMLCDSLQHVWRNKTLTETGVYYDTLQTIHGCDSIFQLNMEFHRTPVGEFSYMIPADAAEITIMPLTFAWNTVPGADNYDLYLWDANDSEPEEPYIPGLPQSYTTISALRNYHTYHWYVVAKNRCHETTSDVYSFHLDVDPYITLSQDVMDFGEVAMNQSLNKNMTITGYYLGEEIGIQLVGEDASSYSYTTTSGWDSYDGGLLIVSFHPTTPHYSYDADIIITSGDVADTLSLIGGVANLYTFNTVVDEDVYGMGEVVPIHGSVLDWDNNPAANVEVEIGVTVMNVKRTILAQTDADGLFTANFEPIATESGYYKVNSGRVGNFSNAVHDEFNILGMAPVSSDLKFCVVAEGWSKTDSILIRNKSNMPLTNITVTPLITPEGCSVSASPLNLAGLGYNYLVYTISGSSVTQGNQYQELKLKASSAEGAETQFSVWYYCTTPRGNLDIVPSMLTTTMTKGNSKIVDIMLTNGGTSPTGTITVELPNTDWMSVVGSDTIPSIPVNDTAYFSLRLSPAEDIALVPYSGSLVLHSERGDDKALPYNITAVSEATGTILVDATDEYTWNTHNGFGPHLAGAHVTITGYYSLVTVAQGYTDEDGHFRAEDLPEGYYRVKVTADRHAEFTSNVSVMAGSVTRVDAFMQYQAVTYSWDVQPTEIEDEYTFELVVTFETNVPKPVITIDNTPTRELEYGETDNFNLIITNQGLITSYDATLTFDSNDEYTFTPLFDMMDSIPAQTTIIVPCQYTRNEPNRAAGFGGNCTTKAYTSSYYVCNMDRQMVEAASHDLVQTTCSMSTTTAFNTNFGSPNAPMLFSGGGYGFGDITAQIIAAMAPAPTSNESCTPCVFTALGAINTLAGCIPGFDGAKQVVQCGITGLVSKALNAFDDYQTGASKKDMLKNMLMNDVMTFECMAEAGLQELTEDIFPPIGLFNCAKDNMQSLLDLSNSCFGGASKGGGTVMIHNGPSDWDLNCGYYLRRALIFENALLFCRLSKYELQLFKEDAWLEEVNMISFLNSVDDLSTNSYNGLISDADAEELASTFVGTSVTHDDIIAFVERYNRTMNYWDMGYLTKGDLPFGMNDDFMEYPNQIIEDAHEIKEFYTDAVDGCSSLKGALSAFYGSKDGAGDSEISWADIFAFVMNDIEEEEHNTGNSVCATVTVKFSQSMTMTREAFNGTFSVHNGSTENSIRDIELNFVVKDKETGEDCTNLFQVNTLQLSNITGIDGAGILGAGLDGNAIIQFIPTKNAAPTVPKVYSFGGTFSFVDPFTGEEMVFDLCPVDMTVNPSPDLYVDYFMQRDILGDDALTVDKVEPSIPAELAVRIHNRGMGTAKNVNLETAEPEIVDNEKGLAIDFNMYGVSYNGNEAQLGLQNIMFGNIESGKTGVGEWLFTSSLLGHFVQYEAHVIHNNSFNNPELSLVSSLRLHELIHPIRVYGPMDDNINDFLVNDYDDPHENPDTIYFSNGGKTGVALFDELSVDDVVTADDTIVSLTVIPSRIGWNYGKCDDPGVDKYELVSCTRDSDGLTIPLQNVWQTFVTLLDESVPLYENKLHIVDSLSSTEAVSYTLVYSLKTNLLDVEEIIGIPDPENYIDYPLTSFQVKFNEAIIDTTFTYQDMTLKCQGGPNLMDESVTITKVADSLYNVDITGLTNETGYYVVTVNTLNVTDIRGYSGYNGKQASWVQYITNEVTHEETLVEGWNWWSSYVELFSINGLEMLENSIGENGLFIKSQTSIVKNYYPELGYNYWFGELQSIDNESSYMINVSADCGVQMIGLRANPANHPITIVPDWNWIGYPVNESENVESALGNFPSEPNDIIKNQGESSIYYANYGWFPQINLIPGKGYLYLSNSESNKIMVYNTGNKEGLAETDENKIWTNNYHEFAENLTVVAAVYLDNERMSGQNIELGAFVGDDYRGSTRLNYFEPLDCYYAVLTVSGVKGDKIRFGIIDRNNYLANYNSQNEIVFEANAVYGNLDTPYEVMFRTDNDAMAVIGIYPNPVDKDENFNLAVPNDEVVSEVLITDMLGNTVRHDKGDNRTANGISAAGVYDVKVITKSGKTYHGRLIVK